MAKIIFEPHDCNINAGISGLEGTVVECEVCGAHWILYGQGGPYVNGTAPAPQWNRLSVLDDQGREYDYNKREPVIPNPADREGCGCGGNHG